MNADTETLKGVIKLFQRANTYFDIDDREKYIVKALDLLLNPKVEAECIPLESYEGIPNGPLLAQER